MSNFICKGCKDGVALISGASTLGSRNNRFSNGTILNSSGAGLLLNGVSGSSRECSDNQFVNIRIKTSTTHGVTDDVDCDRNRFVNVDVDGVSSVPGRGFNLLGQEPKLLGCSVHNVATDNGITVAGATCTGATLIDCFVESSGGHGVFLDSTPARIRIIGLTVLNNGGWGLLGNAGANSSLVDVQGSGNSSGLFSSTGWRVSWGGTDGFLTPASATGATGFRVPHGTAPSSPVNGDMWTTTAGLYIRINGLTVGPLS